MDDLNTSQPTPQTHQQGPTFDQTVIQVVQQYLKSSAFTDRKLTDTPTDNLSVVNRKFVTQNGPTSSRPTSSIIGMQYFDTTLAAGNGKPIYWNGIGWVDATGTFV